MLERVGLDWLHPGTEVGTLSLAVQQLVEIAKVLGESPRVLIFDEPTTALSETETKALLARIHQLRDEGHAVMYVTHHLEEMFEIGDRVTVLRDGGLVTCRPMSEFDHDSLIASMVGRKIESLYPASHRTLGETRLAVRGLRPAGSAAPIDFEVRAGRDPRASPACSGRAAASCCGRSSAPTRVEGGGHRGGRQARAAGQSGARRCRPASAC